MNNQGGFASLFGICVLFIFSALAMAAYAAVHLEMRTTRHFAETAAIQMEAQNGILAATELLREQPRKAAELTANKSKNIWSHSYAESGRFCNVYARKQGETIYLMAESGRQKENEKQKTRIYAQVIKKGNQGYQIKRWGALQ
jgi:type II secretory pathway component PulK